MIYLLSPRPNADLSCAIHSTEACPAHHILNPPPGPPCQPGLLHPSPCQSFLRIGCSVARSLQVHAQQVLIA